MAHHGFRGAPVIFLISRVGNNQSASQYVKALADDPQIGSITYVFPADIAEKWAAFKNCSDDLGYTEFVGESNFHSKTLLS
jgi:hypothetical protein